MASGNSTGGTTTTLPLGAPLPPARRQQHAKPSCTHIEMDKLYGTGHGCSICGRVPRLGWVYACQQDLVAPRSQWLNKARKKLTKAKKRFSAELEGLGFHSSIVIAADSGHYTREQIETLKQQKTRAKETIEAALDENELLRSRHGPSASILSEKLAALEKPAPSSHGGKKQSQDKSKAKSKGTVFTNPLEPCEFKCCHTCRPFARDRTFVSIEAVVDGEVDVPTLWTPEFMPVHHVGIVGKLGLRPSPPVRHKAKGKQTLLKDISYEVSSATQDSYDPYGPYSERRTATLPLRLRHEVAFENLKTGRHAEHYPQMRHEADRDGSEIAAQKAAVGVPTSLGFRESLKKDLADMIKRGEAAPQNASFASMDEQIARTKDEFDVGLWKQLIDKEVEKAAATSLPAENTRELTAQDHDTTVHLPEEHVEGGVALTEEAMENKSPDIIMSA